MSENVSFLKDNNFPQTMLNPPLMIADNTINSNYNLEDDGLNMDNSYNYNNMDNHFVQQLYQKTTWDHSVQELQDMDYVNHQQHEQQVHQIEVQHCSQSFSPSTICIPNLAHKAPDFQNSMAFYGDLTIGSDNTSASSVLYDPQTIAFRELFQSLPRGYSLPTSSRNGSLFGGGDEIEGDRSLIDMGVLEFNRGIVSIGKEKEGKNTKHFATEKQRRDQLNGKYKILRSLIPNPTKIDRASVVGDAIEYIRELLRTINELKLLVDKKRYRSERCKRPKTEDDDATKSCNIRTSWLLRKSKDTEVDVRIIADDVTIKLFQRKKVNCLLFVSEVLDELQLELQHVAGGHVGEYCSFLFNSKIIEGSSVYASVIANRVIDVMDPQYAAAVPHTNSY